MDEDQEQAFETIISGHNVLLTGQAGTGKSFVIKSAVKHLRNRGDNVALTCSTGIATTVFEEEHACTLHKWCGLSDGRYSNAQLLHLISTDEKYVSVKDNILKVKYLFIDEISMISSKTLSQVEFICRSLKRNNLLHFGGITMILSGDFFQLPPVKNELYGDFGHHCFTLPWFSKAFTHHINLVIIHRQSENLLITAVNELERGNISDNTVAFLKSLNRPLPEEQMQQSIHLFARNVDVDLYNYDRVEKMNSPLFTFKSEDSGLGDYLQKILAPKFLGVKVGIPVMLLVNLSDELVNEKIGTVTCIEHDCIYIKFETDKEFTKSVKLNRYLFTKIDPVDNIILAKRSQFPIKVAYAVTVHKSQGMSLESVVVDCKNASFPGQIGVAIGRAKSSDGLMVKNFTTSLIKPHPNVVYKLYENCSLGVTSDDFSCCKGNTHIIDDNNNSDTSSASTNTIDTDEDTYNYFEVEKGASNSLSDFSDMEAEIFELIDEMEMPDKISQAFKKISEDFSYTPLDEPIVKVKSETLELLILFAKWFDSQQNKLKELTLNSFPEGKTKFSAKDFNKFYTDVNHYLQSEHFRSQTSDLAGRYKRVDKTLVFQVLVNICFNFQKDMLMEINDRSEKSISIIVENISIEKQLESSARGKIRYVGGFVIASLKRKNSKILRNSRFAPGKQGIMAETKQNIEFLDSMCSTFSELHETTTDPESLLETKRKQNVSEGLCNITDSCFMFFMMLEEKCRYMQTLEYLYTLRTEMYVEIEKQLLENNDLSISF